MKMKLELQLNKTNDEKRISAEFPALIVMLEFMRTDNLREVLNKKKLMKYNIKNNNNLNLTMYRLIVYIL